MTPTLDADSRFRRLPAIDAPVIIGDAIVVRRQLPFAGGASTLVLAPFAPLTLDESTIPPERE